MSELVIRPAGSDDYPSFAVLFPELRVNDPVPSVPRFCAEIAPSAIIAERDGCVLGYAFFQLIGETGYIRNVVVAPQARGCGIGAALMEALRRRFRDRGARTWDLNVKPDNQPAIRLYERFGLRAQHRSTALGLQWALVPTLPSPEFAVSAQRIEPEEDGRFERALGLLEGQLHSGRSLPGRIVMGLVAVSDRTPAGVAVFDPGFPGASPFRVRHPSLVGALLTGIRTHAQPQQDYLGLFVENDEAAVAVLRAAGATVRLEALHYRGAL